jgi:hypothetical protein
VGSSPDRVKSKTMKLVFVAALRRKGKDWLAWNLDNVFKWGDIYGLLFQ